MRTASGYFLFSGGCLRLTNKLALVKIRIAVSGIKNLHLNERMEIRLNQVQFIIIIFKAQLNLYPLKLY